MILGIDEIFRRVHSESLVVGLSDRELSQPEGAGLDLRAGAIYRPLAGGFLGVDERSTPELQVVARHEPGLRKEVSLQQHEYYLVTTIEEVVTPPDLVGLFRPRSTLFRSGVALLTGTCSPGYRGALTFGIINLASFPFRLELGARIAHLIFHEVRGATSLYRGQWQGGRVSSPDPERQK